MSKSICRDNPSLIRIKSISIAVVFLFICNGALAAEELTLQQKEARSYRAKGLEYQNAADLVAAASFYQKAVALDPFYAAAYNDLAVVYEATGKTELAKGLYLKAIEVDPAFLSAYANLAIVYEQERDLEKAAYYWRKRAELGGPDEPWTRKAQRRLSDIQAVLSGNPIEEDREEQVLKLGREVELEKSLLAQGAKGNKALASQDLMKARRLYKQGREVEALKVAFDAQQMDPSNTEIEEFLTKLSTRLLSR